MPIETDYMVIIYYFQSRLESIVSAAKIPKLIRERKYTISLESITPRDMESKWEDMLR